MSHVVVVSTYQIHGYFVGKFEFLYKEKRTNTLFRHLFYLIHSSKTGGVDRRCFTILLNPPSLYSKQTGATLEEFPRNHRSI